MRRPLLSAVLACLAAACGSDRGITQPSPSNPPSPPIGFIHNSLNAPGDRTLLELETSYDYVIYVQPSIFLRFVYDDFTSPVTTRIRTVSWQGAYCDSRRRGLRRPPAAAASRFYVAFYGDSNGLPPAPGTFPLYQMRLTPAEAHEQFAFDIVGNEADCTYYDYTAVLPSPLLVTAGSRYWLFARPDTGDTGISWGWRVGSGDNGVSALGSLRGFVISLPKDMAFAVSDQ